MGLRDTNAPRLNEVLYRLSLRNLETQSAANIDEFGWK